MEHINLDWGEDLKGKKKSIHYREVEAEKPNHLDLDWEDKPKQTNKRTISSDLLRDVEAYIESHLQCEPESCAFQIPGFLSESEDHFIVKQKSTIKWHAKDYTEEEVETCRFESTSLIDRSDESLTKKQSFAEKEEHAKKLQKSHKPLSFGLRRFLFDAEEESTEDYLNLGSETENCKCSLEKRHIQAVENSDEIRATVIIPQQLSSEIERKLQTPDESFVEMMFRKIDEKGITDADCYHKAQLNRSHFNKIKNDPSYHIQKETVIALAMSLELSRKEVEEMLQKAGYALSRSNKFDIIIEYCISNGIYDLIQVNEILFHFDQKLLGAGIRE